MTKPKAVAKGNDIVTVRLEDGSTLGFKSLKAYNEYMDSLNGIEGESEETDVPHQLGELEISAHTFEQPKVVEKKLVKKNPVTAKAVKKDVVIKEPSAESTFEQRWGCVWRVNKLVKAGLINAIDYKINGKAVKGWQYFAQLNRQQASDYIRKLDELIKKIK